MVRGRKNAIISELESCVPNYLGSDEQGLTVWCWKDFNFIPNLASSATTPELGLGFSQEWLYDQITVIGDELCFHLEPAKGDPSIHPTWNSVDEGNKRAEIYQRRTNGAFNALKPQGREEWLGFNYRMDKDYQIDTTQNWAFFQNKPSDENGNNSPPFALVVAGNNWDGAQNGELVVHNIAQGQNGGEERFKTGYILKAGEDMKIVMHIIYGQGNAGTLQLWINDVLLYDLQGGSTMYTPSSGGGTNKIGIYSWLWGAQQGIDNSAAIGITERKSYCGTVKIASWESGHPLYGTNGYNLVKSR